MFCKNCGAELSDEATVCTSCGAEVKKPAAKKGFSVEKLKFRKGESSIVALVASAVMILMVFLPYVKMEFLGMSETQTLISAGDGIFFLVIAVAGILAGLMGEKKPMIIVGVIACVFALFEVVDFANAVKEVSAYGLGDMVKRGIAFYLMILSAAGLIAAPFVQKFLNK